MIRVFEKAPQLGELANDLCEFRAQRRIIEFRRRWQRDAAVNEPVETRIELRSLISQDLLKKRFLDLGRNRPKASADHFAASDLIELTLHLLDANLAIDIGFVIGPVRGNGHCER